MKKIFIAYADSNMAYSLKRIGDQAHSIGVFDDVLLWTPEKLPQYVLDSPLMKYDRGGGYWASKPPSSTKLCDATKRVQWSSTLMQDAR